MQKLLRCLLCTALLVSGLAPGLTAAQNYPSRTIRIITAGAGGGSDFMSRLVAQGITESLGQPVIVVNFPTGTIPGETAAKSAPDGYTLLVSGQVLWIGPLLRKAPYDPMRDFTPITNLVFAPAVLTVHPSLPVTSVKELIALAKAKPTLLNYASNGTGTLAHLSSELFKYMTGTQIQGIQFSSTAQRMPPLLTGEVQVAFDDGLMPFVKSGKLRGLAVTSGKPSALAPGLPPIADVGVPGYESSLRTGLFAPAKTPDPIIKRVHAEVVKFLNLPATREKLLDFGTEGVGSSPEEMTAIMRGDRERFEKMVKATGIGEQ